MSTTLSAPLADMDWFGLDLVCFKINIDRPIIPALRRWSQEDQEFRSLEVHQTQVQKQNVHSIVYSLSTQVAKAGKQHFFTIYSEGLC